MNGILRTVLLIDPPMWRAYGRRWSHLVSDSSFAELHAFAATRGIPIRGFEGDHYDVPEEFYQALVASGAIPVTCRELLRRLQASGLRRPKRRGERVLGGRVDALAGRRVDTLLSTLAPLAPVTRVHLVLRAARQVLVVDDGVGYALPTIAPKVGENEADAARRLTASLLGVVVSPRQLGYVRTVVLPAAGRPAAQLHAEVVLEASVQITPAASRVSWVPSDHAAALLPLELSPLVHGPFAPAS